MVATEEGSRRAGGMAAGRGGPIHVGFLSTYDDANPQSQNSSQTQYAAWDDADVWPAGCTVELRATKMAVDVAAFSPTV